MDMIGVCGDDCSYCPRYIATQERSVKELEKVKEWWVRLGLRNSDFPAQDLACFGCRPENRCAYSEVRACAREREIANCGLCDRYPCNSINSAFEQSEELRTRAARVCTLEEIDALRKAFFSKKQNLDQIYHTMSKDKKNGKPPTSDR